MQSADGVLGMFRRLSMVLPGSFALVVFEISAKVLLAPIE